MTDETVIGEKIRDLIVEHLDVLPPRAGWSLDLPLFDGGLELDSFSVVELISLIEGELAVRFSEADFVAENFRSLRTLAQLVLRSPHN